MIKSLTIKQFRSHQLAALQNCSRVNLLLGRNNAGKTAVLEALLLLLFPPNPRDVLVLLNEQRGYKPAHESSESWDSLFHNWEHGKPIQIEVFESPSEASNGDWRRLTISPILGSGISNSPSSVIEGSDLSEKTRGLNFNYEFPDGQIERSLTTLNRSSRLVLDLDKVKVKRPPVAFIPTRGITNPQDEAERFSRLEKARLKREVIESLRVVEPRLKDLTVLADGNSSMIYGDLGGSHLMPVSLMGEGMVRMLSIAMAMVNNKGGLVLIDEIENGLHYSVLTGLWRMLFETAKRLDVQVFAATHSDECIRAASETVQALNCQQDLRLFRLDLVKGRTSVTDYDADDLAAAIASEQEVR